MVNTSTTAICAVLWVFAGLRATAATIIPTSQSRIVRAGLGSPFSPPVSQVFTAPDFGPFDAVATATTGSPQDGTATRFAEQHSRILAASITSNGRLGGSGLFPLGSHIAQSDGTFNFLIDQTTPFEILATTVGGVSFDANYYIDLRNSAGLQVGYVDHVDSGGVPQWDSGTLVPGAYTLTVAINNFSNRSVTRDMTYSWYFAIPSPSGLHVLVAIAAMRTRRRRALARG